MEEQNFQNFKPVKEIELEETIRNNDKLRPQDFKKFALLLGISWENITKVESDPKYSWHDAKFEILCEWKQSYRGSKEEMRRDFDTALAKTKDFEPVENIPVSDQLKNDYLTYKLAKVIVKDWKQIGRNLEIPKVELDQINADYGQSQRDAAMEMLLKWKNKWSEKLEDRVYVLQKLLNDVSEYSLIYY